MTESLNRQLDVRPDHWCFGCGRQNPIGLQLTFFEQPDGVVFADWTPERVHQGYEGIVHGGMITTILDEVMGWATSARQLWAVTGTINVRFRKPVEIGEPLRAKAWVASVSGRKVDVQAELVRLSDGALLSSGTAIFIRVSEDQAANWQNRYITDSAD